MPLIRDTIVEGSCDTPTHASDTVFFNSRVCTWVDRNRKEAVVCVDHDRSRAGFTLIEVLLVVAILGILAALVTVNYVGHMDGTKERTTLVQAATMKTGIAHFELTLGRLPKNLDELVVEGDEKWPGPFLDAEEVPTDGWGNEFKMVVKGKRLRVTSRGADGQWDTADDLWK